MHGGRTLLVFEVAGQRYALALTAVKEVVRAVAITPLPAGPAKVEGVISVRGTLVPVLDLRARLGAEPRPVRLSDHLVLAHDGVRDVALRVGGVHWLAEPEEDAVHRGSDLTPDADHVAGIARLPDGLVLIHDLRRFLSGAESRELGEALEAYGRTGASA